MKLEAITFVRMRRLAPILDDILGAGEIESADQALGLASLAQLCSQLVRHIPLPTSAPDRGSAT